MSQNRRTASAKSGPEKAPAEQVLKDIRRQTRRQYSAEEKIRIVLVRGGSVCLNSPGQFYKWFLPLVMPQPGLAAAM
jgi:hypothetical protein